MTVEQGQEFPRGVTFNYVPLDLEGKQDPLVCERPISLNLDKQMEDARSGKTLIVSVPGAFTPTCTANHIPPILSNLEKLKKEKSIELVIVISANDAFVLNAWAKLMLNNVEIGATRPKLLFCSDGNASFSKLNGLSVDASANGMGMRTARYATIIDNDTRKVLYLGKEVEKVVEFSGIDAILQAKL